MTRDSQKLMLDNGLLTTISSDDGYRSHLPSVINIHTEYFFNDIYQVVGDEYLML